MLDAQEEAKALQQAAENPFAAMERGISGGYYGDVYSRYEVAAAWGSIRNRINDDGDFAFSVALNDSVLETGNIQETPFPIALTYVGDAGKDAWGPKQMEEHPEYLERLKQILENCLQTPVALSVKTRALNAQELHQRMQAQMSPYELDIQKEPGLQRLKELFNAELIYSRKSKRQVTVQQTEEDLEMAEQDN